MKYTKDIQEIKMLVRATIEEVKASNTRLNRMSKVIDNLHIVTGALTIGLLISIFFI